MRYNRAKVVKAKAKREIEGKQKIKKIQASNNHNVYKC
jgi:hypothetical protein